MMNVYPNKKVQDFIDCRIQVEMKGENNMLEGLLVNTDDFLNLYMKNTMEIVNGERTRLLGSVILRGNNIILITPVE